MAPNLELKGVFTALVTPFTASGEAVDYVKLRELVEWQIEEGVNGLVPMGTTGESPTVSHDEHNKVIAEVVRYAAGKVPIIAGTGSNCTSEALSTTRAAKEAGCDACLVVNPYYNKPTQEGMYQHFKAVAEVGLPVVLYNIPGRTGVTLTVDTIVRLNELENVVAIKDATGSLELASEIADRCDITILSGDDGLTLPLMSIGGKGVVSVTSNVSPKKMLAITNNVFAGDWEAARKAHLDSFSLFKTMFIETNPQPVKVAMELLGKCSSSVRMPLVASSEDTRSAVRDALVKHNVL